MLAKVLFSGFVMATLLMSASTFAGDLNASCTGGIIQTRDGQAVAEGSLVQLIWAGPDGEIDFPDPNSSPLGAPTGDDVFIRDTYIGNGYLIGYAEGRFDKLFSHSVIEPGKKVYLRAWDTDVIRSAEDSYGDSELYVVQSADEFESYDFPSFQVKTFLSGDTNPVELSNFSISSVAGRVVIEWTTQTETENLGFLVFRSTSPTGVKERMNPDMILGALNSETHNDYKWEQPIEEEGVILYYWIADVATDGTMRYYGPKRIQTLGAPDVYALQQNYPNPFNPSTTITYSLKEPGTVELKVFNLVGQLVRDLVGGEQFAGEYSVEWNGFDNNGTRAPSGLYFYAIYVNGFREIRKMALTK